MREKFLGSGDGDAYDEQRRLGRRNAAHTGGTKNKEPRPGVKLNGTYVSSKMPLMLPQRSG